MNKIKILYFVLRQIPDLYKIIVGYCLSYILAKKKYWIIFERGVDAQDNAWHFFKYIKCNQPNIRVKYAIKKYSPDYHTNLVNFKESVIEYGSIKYYIYLFNAPFIISTHLNTYMSGWLIGKLKKTCFSPKGKIIFLQHGIIHNDHKGLHYPLLKIDLFITGAKREYELISRLYGYPKEAGIVQYTGLARFDNLFDNHPKRKILFMPTWRMSYKNMDDSQFVKTSFYINYASILSDQEIRLKMEKKRYEINFYNHFEFQKFNHLFKPLETECVHILEFGTKRVQDLLKEANLLITDYSSIYYDFLYMKKPIIFFLPDQIEFRKQQYGDDFDNPADFGYVALNYKKLKQFILDSLESDCAIDEKYKRFSDEVFLFKDTQNCERIFNSINKLSE